MKKIKKDNLMAIASIFIAIILLAIVFFNVSFGDVINLLKNANMLWVLVFIGVQILTILNLGFRWKTIILSKGKNIPFFRVVSYNFVGIGISYMLPGMRITGDPVRGLLLKREGLDFKQGFSTVVVDRMIDISVATIFFSFFAIISILNLALPKTWNWVIGIITVLGIFVVFLFYYTVLTKNDVLVKWFRNLRLNKINKLKKFENEIKEFEKEIVHFYRKNKKCFIISHISSLFGSFLLFLGYKSAALIVGQNIGFLQIFLVLIFAGLAMWIPTPLGLGSGEATQAGLFTVLGLGALSGVGLSLIFRAFDFVMFILGLITLSFYGINLKNLIKKGQIKSKKIK